MAFSIKDISSLGPGAQKQILDKLAQGAREQAAIKKAKYHNRPAERTMPNGTVHVFPSQREARRYDELALMLRAGKIAGLKLQPEFTLQESYITAEGQRVRAIRYVADFSYYAGTDKAEYVVEDAKGRRTREYAMKKKMMAEKYGITVREV